MMRGVVKAGLPDKEQTRGMVSSLWISADCVGGYLGDTLGSLAYDYYGFETGTAIMSAVMLVSVVSSCCYVIYLARRVRREQAEEVSETSRLLEA